MEELSDVFFEEKDKFSDAVANMDSKDFPLAITMIYYGVALGAAALFPEIKDKVMENHGPLTSIQYVCLAPFFAGKILQKLSPKVDYLGKKICDKITSSGSNS